MFSNQNGYSLADIAAATGNNGNNSFFGNDGWWIILLFLFAGWGGYGGGLFGGNCATGSGITDGYILTSDFANIERKMDSLANGLCDGFYETTKNLLQGQNQLARDLCTGFAAVNAGISENSFAAQQCCCETNRNIDAVRYENAKNTCEIVRAIEKDGDETRKLIVANQIQDLRDKVAMQSQIIQTKDFALSQQAQNEYLVNTLKPCPIPAYLTCSPYESTYVASRGFNGYGNHCGCGNF